MREKLPKQRQQAFRVTVKRDLVARIPSLPDGTHEVQSGSAVHAAACGLSLAGGGTAEIVEVAALRPAPGWPALTTFYHCSQGIYGFCFASRASRDAVEGR